MTTKKFKIDGKDIKQLIQPIGGCMATDKITVDGELVDFMYRDTPDFKHDSGWRFLSGTESQEYADNADNWAIYDVNTIVNYDSSIVDYLDLPIGTELERIKGTNKFRTVES
ncbi:DUF2185 domain-containing protein [Chryseosolibacter indicus]|uniref:DUF2185 domain-containing protein n=1 Tax=Chryseosolibacter indicus TaxID=2782351 RepID=A0ABS5VYD2_9BACT|nr:DUF2185 domain-containing protein [Chryseosolibacter indicus]MBT1706422.1 DUF2185 domain-containing protein [Chryseosolibacter indicus]